MIELGIFAKTFKRGTLEEVLAAVADSGLHCVQFNMACLGLPSLPVTIDDVVCRRISAAMRKAGLAMAAVSGTFNASHPSSAVRANGIARASELISKCPQLQTKIVTLCTGTRHPEDMWQYHPDNGTKDAWLDLVATFSRLCAAAERHNVILAFEPEVTNVVDNAAKARQLIAEIGSRQLKVVIDPANLMTAGNLGRMQAVLEEAFSLLAPHIVLAHAKDVDAANPELRLAAGRGCLDYKTYIRLLYEIGYAGALILHGLTEQETPGSIKFLRRHLVK